MKAIISIRQYYIANNHDEISVNINNLLITDTICKIKRLTRI